MKLVLTHRDRDVLNLAVSFSRTCPVSVSVRLGLKHPPKAKPADPPDPGPNMRASGSLSSSERAWTPRPSMTVGFTRR